MNDDKYIEWFRTNEKMKIVINDDEIQANGFIIRKENVPVRKKSIVGYKSIIRLDYVVSYSERIPATHWEPEMYEEVEISRELTLGNALLKVLLLEKETDIRNALTALEEEEALNFIPF